VSLKTILKLTYQLKEVIMPKGKGTYGRKRGRPSKKKKKK